MFTKKTIFTIIYFKGGVKSLEDQRHSGRPKTSVNESNIQRVQELVVENHHI